MLQILASILGPKGFVFLFAWAASHVFHLLKTQQIKYRFFFTGSLGIMFVYIGLGCLMAFEGPLRLLVLFSAMILIGSFLVVYGSVLGPALSDRSRLNRQRLEQGTASEFETGQLQV